MQNLDLFQHETLAFLKQAHGRAVIADPMGARKTGTILAWLSLDDYSECAKVLVVAPSSVHGHWERECNRFYPKAEVFRGTTKAKRHAAIEQASFYEFPAVYVTTYESFKADLELLIGRFDTVVFDEGHRLKGRTTQVAKAAARMAKATSCCIIATGTPVVNHAAELWQYLHMLKSQTYRSYWSWVDEHFVVELARFRSSRFPVKIIHGFKPGHEETVRAEIAPVFIQRDIKDLFPDEAWVEEPDHVEIPVDLTPFERKVYDNLAKHKWAFPGVEITTANSLDLTTRLTQITSDWGTLNDQLDYGTKVKAAVELALDLLERDEPVVIFAKYKHTAQRIAAALTTHDLKVGLYTGDISQDHRDLIAQDFAGGDFDVLVGTLDSLSEGVDGLQHRASNIIMVDRHWTPAKNDQAVGRLRRSGQLKRVTVYHVFATDTIDAVITDACLRKTNVIQTLKGMPLKDAIYGGTK